MWLYTTAKKQPDVSLVQSCWVIKRSMQGKLLSSFDFARTYQSKDTRNVAESAQISLGLNLQSLKMTVILKAREKVSLYVPALSETLQQGNLLQS